MEGGKAWGRGGCGQLKVGVVVGLVGGDRAKMDSREDDGGGGVVDYWMEEG